MELLKKMKLVKYERTGEIDPVLQRRSKLMIKIDEQINLITNPKTELAETVAKVVGNKSIEWDTSKPNGTPRKVLNVDKIKSLGWEPKINLEEGIKSTYEWYCSQL